MHMYFFILNTYEENVKQIFHIIRNNILTIHRFYWKKIVAYLGILYCLINMN